MYGLTHHFPTQAIIDPPPAGQSGVRVEELHGTHWVT